MNRMKITIRDLDDVDDKTMRNLVFFQGETEHEKEMLNKIKENIDHRSLSGLRLTSSVGYGSDMFGIWLESKKTD